MRAPVVAPKVVDGALAMTGSRQFLAFKFESDSRFEGQLVGALERIEVGDTMRVLDGLFVARDSESGELSAISLADIPPSRMTSRLLDFRLTARERKTATQRALDGAAGDAVQSLATRLRPGVAVVAVLVEHTAAVGADPLADAVARIGGTEVTRELVDADRITEHACRRVHEALGGAGID
jgi:hypothetical protein